VTGPEPERASRLPVSPRRGPAYALFNSWRMATLLLDSIGGPVRAKLENGGRHGYTDVSSRSMLSKKGLRDGLNDDSC
jgi:hypothetical protein